MTKFHREIIIGGKKFHQCTECNYESYKKSCVLMHIKTHIDKKPFKCDYPSCNFSTRQKGNLKKHIMTHTGEKPFKCPECNYSSNRKASLERHFASKHKIQDKLYHCKHCPFSAVRPYHLKIHVKKFHPTIKFMCSQCEYSVKSKELLEQHLHHCHPEIDWKSYTYYPMQNNIIKDVIQKTDMQEDPFHHFTSALVETINPMYLFDLNPYTELEGVI